MQKIYLSLIIAIGFWLCSTSENQAQLYVQDPAFQSVLIKSKSSYVSSFNKLSDNKLLVIGGMDYVNNIEKISPIRLHEDGSLDASFPFSSWEGGYSVVIRDDGKMISKDLFNGANNEPYVRLSLYQSNGQLDSTFLTEIKSTTISIPRALAVQNDNKVIVGTVITYEEYFYKGLINRVSTDGSIDKTFNTAYLDIRWLGHILVQPDGKILVTGSFGPKGKFRKKLIRLHSDGSLDDSFNPPLGSFGSLYTLTFQKDGRILLGTDRGVVRLLPTGELDDSFTINEYSVRSITIQPDGKILAGCWVSDTVNYIAGRGPVIRLNTNGTIDTSFDAGLGAANHPVGALEVQSNGQILVGGFFNQFNGQPAIGITRLNAVDGQVDSTFSIKLESRGHLERTVVQPDGKILVFGNFNSVNDQSYNGLARLYEDGSIDNSFNIGTGVDGFWDLNGGFVRSVALQEDRKILVGGFFSSFNSVPANSLVRLNENGSVDQSFQQFGSERFYVNTVAIQENGKILVGGYGYHGKSTQFLIRLLPDGSIDPDFTAGDGNGSVSQILVQEDGKILVSGGFTSYNNTSASNIIRLNKNGTVDQTFQATGSNNFIKKIVLQDDGKILALGGFTELNGTLVNKLVRLNNNGTSDETFNPELDTYSQLQDFVLRPDGQILVNGYLFQGDKKIVLLENDGSLNDVLFVLEFEYSFYGSMTSVDDKLIVAAGDKLVQLYSLQQQSITFDTISNKFPNDDSFKLSATASSGLPLTFKVVSGPATLEENIVTLTGQSGLVTIQALQEGDKKFAIAEPKEQSFMVEQQVLGIEDKKYPPVKTYPNPASEYIVIEALSMPVRNAFINLYDMKGKRMPVSVSITHNGYRIDLHQTLKGFYFLQIITGSEKINQKVVLE